MARGTPNSAQSSTPNNLQGKGLPRAPIKTASKSIPTIFRNRQNQFNSLQPIVNPPVKLPSYSQRGGSIYVFTSIESASAPQRSTRSRDEVPGRGQKVLDERPASRGLTAKSLVLSNESQEEFGELLNHYVEFYKPDNTVELDLVHDMVAARWRLQRTRSLETVTLDQRIIEREARKLHWEPHVEASARLALAVCHLANNGRSLDLLLRYETTYSRAFDRAQKALEKMQKTRPESTTTKELQNEPVPEPMGATVPTEPESSTPGNEICETTPSPQPPRQIDEVKGPNSQPQLKE